jgi:hypothetical protein
MNASDLSVAIANLEAKKADLVKRAAAIDAEIQVIAATMRETGEKQNAIVAEQSAIQQTIEWCQVALFVHSQIASERRADIHLIPKKEITCV